MSPRVVSHGDCRRGHATAPFEELSRCEAAALGLAASGLSNGEIAARLGVAEAQVRAQLRAARVAAGTTTERQLLAWYVRRLCYHAIERQREAS